MWIVQQYRAGKDPHELLHSRLLGDEYAAVEAGVTANRQVALQIAVRPDPHAVSDSRALADRYPMAAGEAVADLDARLDDGMAADDCLSAYAALRRLVSRSVVVEIGRRGAEYRMGAYERTVTQRHLRMDDAERLDYDVAADHRAGTYDAGRMHPIPGHRTMIGGRATELHER